MAYFKDLSTYSYSDVSPGPEQPPMKNIGFLEPDRRFSIHPPTEEVLDRLWEHCKISIEGSRGSHQCKFCQPPPKIVYASRKGSPGLFHLGASQIVVFSEQGEAYVAPNLVYHYVHVHHYNPPDEFLEALIYGPGPTNPVYFGHLRRTGFEWHETPFSTPSSTFDFENIDGELIRYEVRDSTYLDQS
jgi:hypothetical protein